MSVFNFVNPSVGDANRDLIKTKFRQLAETAKSNLHNAEKDAIRAEGFCLTYSPSMCLVLQFGALLLVQPYALLATLDLGDSYFFDISKLSIKSRSIQEARVKEFIGD